MDAEPRQPALGGDPGLSLSILHPRCSQFAEMINRSVGVGQKARKARAAGVIGADRLSSAICKCAVGSIRAILRTSATGQRRPGRG